MDGFIGTLELAQREFRRSIKKAGSRKEREMRCLLSLAEVLASVNVSGQVYRGMSEVPLERVVGSVNKEQDFDADFNPKRIYSQARWERLFAAVMAQESLPPVDLYRVGCFYFVVDGHHRISVAKRFGMSHIDAHVTEYVTGDLRQISGLIDLYHCIRRESSNQNRSWSRILDFRLPVVLHRRSYPQPECPAC